MKKFLPLIALFACARETISDSPTVDSSSSDVTGEESTYDDIQTVSGPDSSGSGSGSDGPPIICGDGRVDVFEECDDGNENNTDECLNDCRLAYCGDSYIHFGVEECDDGILNPNEGCRPGCTKSTKLIFISKDIYPSALFDTDELTSLGIMDLWCSDQAYSSQLPGDFQALIAISGRFNNSQHPLFARLNNFRGSYINTQIEVVADGVNGFFDLKTAIKYDQYGSEVKEWTPVWTGVDIDGVSDTSVSCNFWTNSGANLHGIITLPNAVGNQWWYRGIANCDSENVRIICVQVNAE